MLWLAALLILTADAPEEHGIAIPRARPASERTLKEQTVEFAATIKEEVVELPSVAVHAPIDMMKVVLGPIRDSYQLVPGWQEPVLPVPQVKDDPLGTTNLMVRDANSLVAPKWKYRIEGGGNFRYGTADTSNINTLFAAERRSAYSLFTTKFGATYNHLDNAADNRRFFGDSKYDWFMSGRWIVYSKEELENDQARHIELRSVTSAGLGYRMLDDASVRWIARTGPTVTYLNQNNPGPDDTSTVRSGWLIDSEFRRIFWEHCRLEWNCSVFPNFAQQQTIRIRNEVGVLFPVGHKSCWNWKMGLRDEYTENPGPTVSPHDTEMYFAIVYSSG